MNADFGEMVKPKEPYFPLLQQSTHPLVKTAVS